MISGAHVMIFTRDEDADRAFHEPFTASWGRATSVPLPGGGKIGLYEPQLARP
jgi:hypothetical protein